MQVRAFGCPNQFQAFLQRKSDLSTEAMIGSKHQGETGLPRPFGG
jgi:hypothetical protein